MTKTKTITATYGGKTVSVDTIREYTHAVIATGVNEERIREDFGWTEKNRERVLMAAQTSRTLISRGVGKAHPDGPPGRRITENDVRNAEAFLDNGPEDELLIQRAMGNKKRAAEERVVDLWDDLPSVVCWARNGGEAQVKLQLAERTSLYCCFVIVETDFKPEAP